jgi:hypothetical protein
MKNSILLPLSHITWHPTHSVPYYLASYSFCPILLGILHSSKFTWHPRIPMHFSLFSIHLYPSPCFLCIHLFTTSLISVSGARMTNKLGQREYYRTAVLKCISNYEIILIFSITKQMCFTEAEDSQGSQVL